MKGAEDSGIVALNEIMTVLFLKFFDPDEWAVKLEKGEEKAIYEEGRGDVWDTLDEAWKEHGAALDHIQDYEGPILKWWLSLSA